VADCVHVREAVPVAVAVAVKVDVTVDVHVGVGVFVFVGTPIKPAIAYISAPCQLMATSFEE
jgi:hypothetical protein